MLERDDLNEKFMMDQIKPIIEGQPTSQVFYIALSLLGSCAITTDNPKGACLEVASHFLKLSKLFNKDGTLKSDEEFEK